MPISLRFSIALVLSIVCLAVPAWADFQAGMDAYNRKDYATALREWRPLAEQGDADAQYNLALMYDRGYGVPQDYVQARQWYEKAAAQGDARPSTTSVCGMPEATACRSDLPPVIRPPVLLVRMLQEPVADSPRRCGAGRDYRFAASVQ